VGKNGNGEGNIRRRKDGRYEARYCVETLEGLKRRSVYGKTRKEAAERLAAKIANKDTEPVQKVEQTTITARDFFAEYLAAMKDTIKRRSYETSDDIIRLHLNPEFGSMNLTDLDRKGIQSMYARKREGLSAARVKRIHSVLAASLNVAVRWGYIQKNPCDAVSKPKVPHRMAADFVAFLQEHDGHWKGSATELHKQLLSSVKPVSPDVLSKTIGEIAARTPTLTVKHGWKGKNRVLTLTLDSGVGSVGGVGNSDDCACGGQGCLECLTQELPFEAN